MIKILILIDSSTEFSRRFLSGLARYANENGPWAFYRIPQYYITLYGEVGILERIKAWHIDAVISQWEFEDTSFLNNLDIPVFLQGYKDSSENFSKIVGDYVGPAKMAAQFFAKRRFKNFAFYGNKNFYWSKARAEAFRQEVEKLKGNYFFLETESLNDMQWGNSHILLNDWLTNLPKPVGLFACDDNFALQVSEMCKINDITIPGEISLLGLDNDELLCNLSFPSISSIVTDDENGGYETGKNIHMQISSKVNVPFYINIKPIQIKLRLSTEGYGISDKYISDTLRFIDENIYTNITIDQLTSIVPMSRRNLEKKFRDTMGKSIHQFILDKKVESIIDELINTEKSLLEIAMDLGFTDVRNAYRIFKEKTGYTPMDYRKKFSPNHPK